MMIKRIVYLIFIALLLLSGYKFYQSISTSNKLNKALKLAHSKNYQDWKKAIDILEKDPQKWSSELYTLYEKVAQMAMAKQNWAEAVYYLKKALKVKPGDPSATLDLAISTANLGKATGNQTLVKEAFELYRKSASLMPDNPLPYYGMGILKFWFWDNSPESKLEGIKWLKEAIEKDPSFVRGYLALARAYYEVEDIPHALETYKKVLEILPPHGSKTAQVYLNIYRIYRELQKQTEEAYQKEELSPSIAGEDLEVKKLEALKKAYKADPSNPDVIKALQEEGIRKGTNQRWFQKRKSF